MLNSNVNHVVSLLLAEVKQWS